MEIGLFTGGRDRPYVFGLVNSLDSDGIRLHLVGGDELDASDIRAGSNLRFVDLHGKSRPDASRLAKVWKVLSYYARVIPYAAIAKPRIFHILWNGKFEYFDRTLLALYFKLLGKKIVLTAHNVNAGQRDSNDSWLNRLTLAIQYRLADHIFVHTEQMKSQLLQDFGVRADKTTVIPFGINNSIPCTDLTSTEAKRRLGLIGNEKTILFFGNIGPYKGLDHLVTAFQSLSAGEDKYRLIIAGKHRTAAEEYVNQIRQTTRHDVDRGVIVQRIQHIPDSDVEIYFKAADVLVLPYTHVFQSGVMFLGYFFGVPVVATDVGSLKEDIVEGRTGFLCQPSDPVDLAETIKRYFESDLFENLSARHQEIRDYADERHSWEVVADRTRTVYASLAPR